MDKGGLSLEVIEAIAVVVEKYEAIEKIVLFGSRARGENRKTSDIDLAIYGNNIDQGSLAYQLDEEVPTLLEFDLSVMQQIEDRVFIEQVEKDGIVIYEKY
ncbi:MAG: nucleotidyltransferase domain-containing protein [Cellulosilyticaceae bacterium]